MRVPLVFVAGVFVTQLAVAQTPQRLDFIALLNRVPKPPANTQDALQLSQQPNPYYPFANEMSALQEKLKQLNPVSVRKQNGAIAMDAKFKADGVDKMTDSQKLDYAKKNNLGGDGSGARIDFAKQMQDPAFQKKFQAMSPQEKMAYMQQQGVMQTPSTAPQSSNPMQADMMAMMQDPAMREKWKNMSPAERQAFIEAQKKAKGYDSSRRPAAAQSNSDQGFGSLLDDSPSTLKTTTGASAVTVALSKSKAFQDAVIAAAMTIKALSDKQTQQTDQAKADLQKTIQAMYQTNAKEGLAEAKRQGKSGNNWILTNTVLEKQTRVGACQQRQRLDNTTLTTAATEWSTRLATLQQAATDYQTAMNAIGYGEALFSDDSQFQNLATLSGYQAAVFGGLKDIDEAFNQMAKLAAETQTDLTSEQKASTGPRQLIMTGEG